MEKNLLYFMFGNIEMAKVSTQYLVDISDDIEFRNELLKDLSEYEKFYDKIIRQKNPNEKLKHISVFLKLMLKLEIIKNIFKDKSPKKMSQMLINGFKIGIDDIDENISKAIKLNENPEIIQLAKEYKSYIEKNMNKYNRYIK